MLEFEILQQSKKSRARLGLLKTPHGIVETPSLVPVATQAVVKTLTSQEVEATGSQLLISNTFHLHLRPGEKIIKSNGGIHDFMCWDRPLMTDSGGFQVFSLGFGMDLGLGKLLKTQSDKSIGHGQQPKLLKISDEGVLFTSPIDGSRIFIGPKESIKIQEDIGADIIFAFDECTPPIADHAYTARSLERTHHWAQVCLETKKTEQALFGIVQGGRYKDLRIKSTQYIGSLPFDGFGIGGEFGDNKKIMTTMIKWVIDYLPEDKPRHLLGIGKLEDIPKIIKAGVDTFDCTIPTHYARRGIVFTSKGKLNLNQKLFAKDRKPLDPRCSCSVCATYSRSYIHHLLRAKEITGLRHLTFHNLYYFNMFIKNIRTQIKRGRL